MSARRAAPRGVLVRAMEDHDTEGVVDLLWQLNRYEAPISGDRPLERAGAARCLEACARWVAECDGAHLVAEAEDGALAGYLCWGVALAGPYVRPELRAHGFVQDLVVDGARRGAGVGRALMAEAERLTRKRGLKRLMLGALAGNAAALGAYARLGFRAYAVDLVKEL